MEPVMAFLQMGGYAAYVWPSFALVAALMVGLLVSSTRRLRESGRLLARLQAERRCGRDEAQA